MARRSCSLKCLLNGSELGLTARLSCSLKCLLNGSELGLIGRLEGSLKCSDLKGLKPLIGGLGLGSLS